MEDNPIRGAIGTWWGMFALMTFFLLVRLYAKRTGPIGRFTSDDWVLVASWIFMSAFLFIFAGFIMKYNLSDPKGGLVKLFSQEDVTDGTAVLKGFYVATSFGFISACLSKLSLLMLYIHLFQGVREMRWWLISFLIFLVASSIGIIIYRMFSCSPMSMNWDATLLRDALYNAPFVVTNRSVAILVASNKCLLHTLMYAMYALYAQAILTDIGLIALAIPLLKKANLSKRDSVGIFLTFSLAGLTIAASTARAVVLLRDGSLVGPTTWGYIEGCLCIVVTSMVTLRTFAVQIVNLLCDKVFCHCCGMRPPVSRKSSRGQGGTSTTSTNPHSTFKDHDGEPRRWVTQDSNVELDDIHHVREQEPRRDDIDLERGQRSSRLTEVEVTRALRDSRLMDDEDDKK